MKRTMRVLAGSLLIALSPLASAQTTGDPIDTQVMKLDTTAASRGQTLVAGKIASNFNNFAGSDKNSLALVNALRNGTNATLTYTTPATTPGGTPTTTTTTYDPPTGKMGWGNVKIALALAQDSLARAGITNPTAEQLQAALNGGTVTVKNADGTTTTTTLKGVLQMRADGMGWGEIAKANGTKVGPVVSQLKMANSKVAALPATDAKTTAAGSTTTTPGSKSSKGIATAAGAASTRGSSGLVTADGVSATQQAKGNAYGRGVVTGSGGSATNVAATGGGKPSSTGAGVVTGTGGASGVTTGHGNSGGNGNGNAGGNGNGKGKGG